MPPSSQPKRCYRFGLFQADVACGTLLRQGVPVRLQEQPFRVLTLLLERAGDVVTREELRQELWPADTFVEFEGSLNAALKKLRSALGDSADNPIFIERVPKRGYRFIAPVQDVAPESPAVEESVPGPGPAPVSESPQPLPLTPTAGASRRTLAYGALLVTVAVIALAVFAFRFNRHAIAAPSKPSLPPVSVRKSVAVLGFQNLSGKSEDDWLSTAFAEMLSTELAGGEKLRLVPGEDIANLRSASPWPSTGTLGKESSSRIGAALNSDLLVLGDFTNIGDNRGQLRVDVRLQDARTGEILTEIAETGSRQDLFQTAARMGTRIRERLGVPPLTGNDEAGVLASLPLDRDAARFYSLGVAKLRDFDALAAKDLLEQASKADPKFPMVHVMLARAWSQLGYEQKRKDEAKKALDLSTDLPRSERFLVEGDYYESLADHEKAASTYRVLFELFPDSVDNGLLLASAQNAAGHGSQAQETIAQLRTLPPPESDDPQIDLLDARLPSKSGPARLALLQNAERKATARGQKLVYARARQDECRVLFYGDQPDQGTPACDDAYNIFMAAGNRLGAADTIRLKADHEGSQGHLEQAITTYEEALKILQQLGEDYKTGAALNNMAIDVANEGKLDRAQDLYRQAMSHFEKAGDKTNTATATSNIADIMYLRGDLHGATTLYKQALEILATVDHSNNSYVSYRLADLESVQGHPREALPIAQQVVELTRADQSDYGNLTGAMIVIGEILKAEGDLPGAKKQFDEVLEIRKKVGEMGGVHECEEELAELALDEGHPDQAEPLLRAAITEFEKEKGDPDTASAYTLLSRTLLMQNKPEEARKAVEHASVLARSSDFPSLTLPIKIQTARVEIANAGTSSSGRAALVKARQRLHSTIATARKLGYSNLEYEARLALGDLELTANPSAGHTLLVELATETHARGMELISRQAAALAAEPDGIATARVR